MHCWDLRGVLNASAAISYPARLLSRAVNPLSNEVLQFVNADNCVIVICDLDGSVAAPACALLGEKGVQNAALLHGGEPFVIQSVTRGSIPSSGTPRKRVWV